MRSFWRDSRGSVAIIFALSAMVLITLAGAAVDFGTAHYVKSSLQGSVDSALLAASKESVFPTDVAKTQAKLTPVAQRMFDANNRLSSDLVTVQPLTVTYTPPVGSEALILAQGSGCRSEA